MIKKSILLLSLIMGMVNLSSVLAAVEREEDTPTSRQHISFPKAMERPEIDSQVIDQHLEQSLVNNGLQSVSSLAQGEDPGKVLRQAAVNVGVDTLGGWGAENKEWTQANYGYVTTYSKNSMSIVSANMTRDQILKIARAEKVGFALDAVGEPIRGELDQGDLQPIREFADKCLVQK